LNLADGTGGKKVISTDFTSGNQWVHNYVRRMFNNSKILPMRRFFSLILMVVFLIVIALSCSKSNGDSGGGSGTGGSGGNSSVCSGTAGTLFTAVKSIMETHCAVSGCHAGNNPQSGINLANNCTIVNQKDRIKVRSVDQAGTPSQMPPPPRAPLTTAERQAITNWIAAGGKFTD
jgi:uncharacterized membrane protein